MTCVYKDYEVQIKNVTGTLTIAKELLYLDKYQT